MRTMVDVAIAGGGAAILASLYDADLLVALFIVFNIVVMGLVVVTSARSLNRGDTKRQDAEEELASANAERQQRATMIQSVLESIGDGVILVGPDGKRIYNLAAKRILGIDLSGLPVTEWNQAVLVFRADQKTVLPLDEFPTARASRGETVDDMEVFVRHAGAPKGFFVSASARPLRNERGESQGVVAIFRDLTIRRQAEEMQRQLAAIVQSTDDAMFSLDVEGMVTGWNAGSERLFGWTVESVMGKDPWPPTNTPESIERRAKALRGERIDPYESEVVAKGGRLVPVLISVSQIRDSDGSVVGAAVSIRDITPGTRERGARLRLAAGVGPTTGKLPPPDHADETPEILERIKIAERIDQYEAVRRQKDGQLVDVSITVSPIYDSKGVIVGASVIARDISERRRTEAEIRRLNTNLERRVAERTAELEAANKELE